VQVTPASTANGATTQTTTRTYAVPTASNRPSGYSQSSQLGTAAATTPPVTSAIIFTYNANGDLTSDGERSYSYDASGRLSAATTGVPQTASSPTTRYGYNALGQRIFKTEPLYPPASSTSAAKLAAFANQPWNPGAVPAEGLGYAFMYDEDGTLLSEVGTGGANSAGSTYYIYLPTPSGPMPIAVVVNRASVYAVHSDHLNTPRRLTRPDGKVVWQWAYSAFGDETPTTAAKRFTSPTTTPTTGRTNLEAVTFNLRYPGQVVDGETGLSYNYFRSYDSRTGRYTQGDPIGLDGGWNRYLYANASPLMFTDALGLQAYNGQTPPTNIPGGPWTPQAGQQPGTIKALKTPMVVVVTCVGTCPTKQMADLKVQKSLIGKRRNLDKRAGIVSTKRVIQLPQNRRTQGTHQLLGQYLGLFLVPSLFIR
jgi:RHS repeat-associated protein